MRRAALVRAAAACVPSAIRPREAGRVKTAAHVPLRKGDPVVTPDGPGYFDRWERDTDARPFAGIRLQRVWAIVWISDDGPRTKAYAPTEVRRK